MEVQEARLRDGAEGVGELGRDGERISGAQGPRLPAEPEAQLPGDDPEGVDVLMVDVGLGAVRPGGVAIEDGDELGTVGDERDAALRGVLGHGAGAGQDDERRVHPASVGFRR